MDVWLIFEIVKRGGAVVMLAAIMAGITACSSTQPPPPKVALAFSPADGGYFALNGKATLKGKAIYQRASGRVLKAVGENIYLIARTPYAEKVIATNFGKHKMTWDDCIAANPEYQKYWQTTISSTSGSFSFKKVPDGRYFVLARILFPSGGSKDYIWVYQEAEVRGGKSEYVTVRGF